MSYRFESNTRLDPAVFAKAMQKQPKSKQTGTAYWVFLFWSIVLGLVVLFAAATGSALLSTLVQPHSQWLRFGLTLLPFVIVIVTLLGLYRSFVRAMYERILQSPLYDGPIEYALDNDGFSMTSDTAEWRVAWRAIDHVKYDTAGLFMYAGGFVYVLPFSCVAHDQRDILVSDVRAWHGVTT